MTWPLKCTGWAALAMWACSAAFAANPPLGISEDELASTILAPSTLVGAPRMFNRLDMLNMDGVSLEFSWAEYVGDTLRLHDILLGGANAWADFRFDGGQYFVLVQSGYGRGDALSRPEIPGVDSSVAIASLQGPPFGVTVLPIGLQRLDHVVTLGEFDLRTARFRITQTQVLNQAASDNLRGRKTTLATTRKSVATIDAYIEESARLDISLPTQTDWSNAMLGCLSVGIDRLQVSTKGDAILKMLAKDSPSAMKDAYEAAALGHPADASLILSELAFKGLAIAARDRGELGAFLDALADKSDYGKALAKGAGACTVDYKEAGKVVLEGLARAAFPLSSCGADVMLESAKELRGLVTDALVRKVYDKYRQDSDPLVDWSLSGYGHPLVTQYALKNGIDTARAERELNALFAAWKAREGQVGPIRQRLLQLKTRWAEDKLWLEAGIRLSLPAGATEAEVFAAYVHKMNATRARLTAFASPLQDLDASAGLVLRSAYLHGSASVPFDVLAWKKATAAALQGLAAGLFKAEPAVCSVDKFVDQAWVLVDVTDFNPTPYNNGFYATTIGYARGNVAMGWSQGSNVFNFSATWSNPPQLIRKTDTVAMSIGLAVTQNTGTAFFVSGAMGLRFDVAGIEPGYVNRPIEFTSASGDKGALEVSRGGSPGGTTLTRSLSLEAASLPSGAEGSRVSLLAYIHGFQNTAGTRYTYEWKAVK
ncbi:hypothetical protein [Ideonella sp. A 288]|uniref:hypothetical protein n=1 Tax=Ideonella sp. A 288 TaxID=1962181 RepID=UPI001185C209|nr:hypothetical protein [Ideonella sp. A 288]